MTTMIELAKQHPGAVLDHAVSFGTWLAGDTLESPPAVVVSAGLTLTPAGKPAPAISGSDVVFWLGGGTSGTTYNVQVTITTAAGRVQPQDCQITILDLTP
ncbi:hypothetical protein [Sandarakinorhabdus sp.]|uniref:phage fiber-tail adaptor protein n=1 Tax=Sandarakinorhabdus sp. TaxID=1916663 RepID=UPI0035656646